MGEVFDKTTTEELYAHRIAISQRERKRSDNADVGMGGGGPSV